MYMSRCHIIGVDGAPTVAGTIGLSLPIVTRWGSVNKMMHNVVQMHLHHVEGSLI